MFSYSVYNPVCNCVCNQVPRKWCLCNLRITRPTGRLINLRVSTTKGLPCQGFYLGTYPIRVYP